MSTVQVNVQNNTVAAQPTNYIIQIVEQGQPVIDIVDPRVEVLTVNVPGVPGPKGEQGDIPAGFNDLTASFNAFTSSYNTGSFTGSFYGDGSQLTGIVSSKWTGSNPLTRQSDVQITGSLAILGSIRTSGAFSGSFSGSYVGNGSGLTNIPAAGIVGLNLSQIATGSVTASVSTETGSFVLTSGSSTFLYVSSSGNIGISTNTPPYKLSVNGSGTVAGFYGNGSAATGIQVGGGETGTLFIENQTNGGGNGINIYTQRGNTSFNIGYRTTSGANGGPINIGNLTSYAAGNINFLQNGSTKLTIDTAGNVGIGVPTPAYKLDISSSASTGAIRVMHNNTAVFLITGSRVAVGNGITNAAAFEVYNAGTRLNNIFIGSSGNNFIGTAGSNFGLNLLSTGLAIGAGVLAPSAYLHVFGPSILGGTTLVNTTASAGFTFDVSGSARITNGLTVTGSFIANSITGSIFGTSSYAIQSLSSSYAETASYAPMYLPLSGGTVTGDLQVYGTASISYLNVTYESASIIYSTGSNQLGDAANDTQSLYGSVVIPTGSLYVSGSSRMNGGLTVATGSIRGEDRIYASSAGVGYGLTLSHYQITATVGGVLLAFGNASLGIISDGSILGLTHGTKPITNRANQYLGTMAANAFVWQTSLDPTNWSTYVSRMVMFANGNLILTSGSIEDTGYRMNVDGIGAPNGALRVSGSLVVSGSSLANPTLTVTNGGVQFGSTTGFVWDAANNRLGIGTNAPAYSLDVNGDTRISNFIISGGSINYQGTNTSIVGYSNQFFIINSAAYGFVQLQAQGASGSIRFAGSGGSEYARMFSNTGNWLLQAGGTFTDSGYRLEVNGSGSASGSLRVVSGSTLLVGAGSTSATNALVVQNSSATNLLTVRNDGLATFGGSITQTNIGDTLTIGSAINFVSSQPTITGLTSLSLVTGNAGQTNIGKSAAITSTSGFFQVAVVGTDAGNFRSFSPASGTAQYTVLRIAAEINQTGGANGITRGLYVNPTLTAAADFRAIEWSNNASGSAIWGLYGSGSAPNYLAGGLGIGTTSVSAGLTVWNSDIFIKSDRFIGAGNAEASYGSVWNRIQLYNGSNGDMSITLHSTAWWLRHNANMSIAGNTLIGLTSSSGERLQVSGSSRFIGNMVITGSGSTSATSALFVQNGAGARLLQVRNDNALLFGDGNVASTYYGDSNIAAQRVSVDGISLQMLIGSGNNVGGLILSHAGTHTKTFGTTKALSIEHNFTPTSGNATFTGLNYAATISQSGGANGTTRGLYVNPTLTAAADWRSIEWSNNSGWGLYGSGSASNYLAGRLSIGTTVTGSALTVYKSGSTVVDVQGSTGQLFSVVDSMTGSLMSVNDISGIPLLSVNSNGAMYMNSALQNSITSSYVVYSIDSNSGNAAYFDYRVFSPITSGSRAGTLMAVWFGSSVEYTDTSTNDLIADTSGISLSADITGSLLRVNATVTTGSWNVKIGARVI